jgi:hypothetical protein
MKALTGILALVTMSLSVSAFARPGFAGPNDGGGGKGVVCRNEDGSIKSVELLDLWEARMLYDHEIVSSKASIDDQIKAGIERLKNVVVYPYEVHYADRLLKGGDALADSLRRFAIPINSENWGNVKRLRGVTLAPTQDSFEDASPTGCQIEQLVRYKDAGLGGGTNEALMNQDLVDRMDLTNKAALALHEALYAVLREFGETTSLRVRRAVGYAMSGRSFKSLDSFLKGPHITCESAARDSDDISPRTRIHYAKQSNGLVTIFPEKIGGILMMGFEQENSGTDQSVEELYRSIAHGGGFGGGVGLSTSPVDFDLSAMVMAKGKGVVEIQLRRSASGVPALSKENLRCTFVK